jgi:protoheme IX farnesyltransferase
VRSSGAPGAWLRLTAFAAVAGTLLAVVSGALDLDTTHRALAALAAPPLVALVLAGWFTRPALLAPASLALVFFGGAALVTEPSLHVVLAALAAAATGVTCALTFRGEPVPAGAWRDYLTLTKPRIMSLLLLTGACGMVIGERGLPDPGLFAATMLGLALACGGASALNHVLDADIDRLMGKRTAKRPVAAGRIEPGRALEFGLALSAFSFVLLASVVNVVAALLALAGGLFYVLVYTRWLKRSTPQNIVIGGAAGAVPPLVGWAAATGDLSLPALLLFLIVFFWTPPHFWALALLLKQAYADAHVPMLPVVRGERATIRQIVLYTVVLIAITLLPVVSGTLGAIYATAAIVLGSVFLLLTWRLRSGDLRPRAALLFHYSLAYLALLFVAAAVDVL